MVLDNHIAGATEKPGMGNMVIRDADIDSMDEGELRELLARVQKALDRIVSKRARRTLKEAKRLALEVGYEATFAKPGRSGRGTKAAAPKETTPSGRAKVAPKYRNPGNPAESWTGRGRKPRWVQAALAEGQSLSDFAIS
jgi:DNA-binding protein H-NS